MNDINPRDLRIEKELLEENLVKEEAKLERIKQSLKNNYDVITFLINRFLLDENERKDCLRSVETIFSIATSYNRRISEIDKLNKFILRFRVNNSDHFFDDTLDKNRKRIIIEEIISDMKTPYSYGDKSEEEVYDYFKGLAHNPYEALPAEEDRVIENIGNYLTVVDNITVLKSQRMNEKFRPINFSDSLLARLATKPVEDRLSFVFHEFYQNGLDVNEYYDSKTVHDYYIVNPQLVEVVGNREEPMSYLYTIYSLSRDYDNLNNIDVNTYQDDLKIMEDAITQVTNNYFHFRFPYDYNRSVVKQISALGMETPKKLLDIYSKMRRNIITKLNQTKEEVPVIKTAEDIRKEFNNPLFKDDNIHFIYLNYMNNQDMNRMAYLLTITSLMTNEEIVTFYKKIKTYCTNQSERNEIAYNLSKVIAFRLCHIDLNKVDINYIDRHVLRMMYSVCISPDMFYERDIKQFDDLIRLYGNMDYSDVDYIAPTVSRHQASVEKAKERHDNIVSMSGNNLITRLTSIPSLIRLSVLANGISTYSKTEKIDELFTIDDKVLTK